MVAVSDGGDRRGGVWNQYEQNVPQHLRPRVPPFGTTDSMKQVLLAKGSGTLRVAEVPAPRGGAGGVVIRTRCSVISSGTERAALASASQSLIARGRGRPELVRRVWELVRERGLLEAYQRVRDRLEEEVPLGYSLAGEVVEGGAGGLASGTRVVGVGAAACHAEVVEVPPALVVPMPDGVDDETGAFVAFGAIAMHGLRLARASLGDEIAVIGCGLVGLLTVQLLKAAGCVVHALDLMPARAALARRVGGDAAYDNASDIERGLFDATRGRGADAVLITAATSSSEPVSLAGRLARDRGAVVVVGDVGMDVPRDVYFAKELSLRVSRSYGPGRYDPQYEGAGVDYPAGYVAWTERRNCEAFLRLAAGGVVRTAPLVLGRWPISAAPEAYEVVEGRETEGVAAVLTYEGQSATEAVLPVESSAHVAARSGRVRVGVLGVGEFARAVLLPAFQRRKDVQFVAVAATTPASCVRAAKQFGFRRATTAAADVWNAADVDAVIIATRHDTHGMYAAAALGAGKAVFVEKPLAIDREALAAVRGAVGRGGPLQVGLNRRFSPLATALRDHVASSRLVMQYRVNAGYVAPTHWTRDPGIGGGRVIGEVCHFLDLLAFLAGRPPRHWSGVGGPADAQGVTRDGVTLLLDYGDAGTATLAYATAPTSGMQKERIEIIATGRAAVLDDFRRLELWTNGQARRLGGRRAQKGFDEEVDAFVQSVLGKRPAAQAFDELAGLSELTFEISAALLGV